MSVLSEICITSSSIFSREVSLRAQVSIGSSYLYSKYYHAMRVFSNLIFAIIARILRGNHLNKVEISVQVPPQKKKKNQSHYSHPSIFLSPEKKS